MLSPIYLSFLFLSNLICHAADKESHQIEKDAKKSKEDVSKDVTTDLPFSDAVDNRDRETSTTKVESSKIESAEVKSTTVGYVEITQKAQEKHFQMHLRMYPDMHYTCCVSNDLDMF